MKNGSSKTELKQDVKMTKNMTPAQKSAYMKADKKMHALGSSHSLKAVKKVLISRLSSMF